MAFALVQQIAATFPSNNTSKSATLGAGATVGNLFVVAFGSTGSTTTVSSMSHTGSTLSQRKSQTGGTTVNEIWSGIVGGTGTSVSVTQSAKNASAGFIWTEFSGNDASGTLDGAGSAGTAISTAVDTGGFATSDPNDLVFASAANQASGTYGAVGGGFTDLTKSWAGLAAAYKIETATETADATWTVASQRWCATLVAFLPAAAVPSNDWSSISQPLAQHRWSIVESGPGPGKGQN